MILSVLSRRLRVLTGDRHDVAIQVVFIANTHRATLVGVALLWLVLGRLIRLIALAAALWSLILLFIVMYLLRLEYGLLFFIIINSFSRHAIVHLLPGAFGDVAQATSPPLVAGAALGGTLLAVTMDAQANDRHVISV